MKLKLNLSYQPIVLVNSLGKKGSDPYALGICEFNDIGFMPFLSHFILQPVSCWNLQSGHKCSGSRNLPGRLGLPSCPVDNVHHVWITKGLDVWITKGVRGWMMAHGEYKKSDQLGWKWIVYHAFICR